MTVRNKIGALDAAIQYMTWALEEIAKFGHPEAALHARIALEELSRVRSAHREAEVRHDAGPASHYAEEAKRFRDKAEEAEQLAELAQTASRRDALMKIAESNRRTAEQMNRLSEAQNTGRKANS